MFDKILFVDDDPITLMLCKKVIAKSSFSHEIITAQNGEEALHHFNTLKYTNDKNKRKPELIFLDLNMPIMNGWECLRELKSNQRYKDIPVIMISTSSHKNDMDMASNLGSICYFVKPNNFENINIELSNLTNGQILIKALPDYKYF